jgi:ABC-type phosphate/phosphonate transport system substrate-binding protein
MPAVASLPMYDFPELAAATDALWAALAAGLRRRGVAAPGRLTRPAGDLHAHWRDPDLLLSQCCMGPVALTLGGAVRVIAHPVYDAEGCEGPTYRSALVARAADAGRTLGEFRGRTAAVNGPDSLSGRHALREALAPFGPGRFFGGVVVTGAHRASARAVAEGRADLAAIDCVSWALIGRVEPALAERLTVVGWTAPAPSLPLVTAAGTPPAAAAALRDAVAETFAAPGTAEARATLGLTGATPPDPDAAAAVAARAAAADRAGTDPLR